jgi:hypothetical protein
MEGQTHFGMPRGAKMSLALHKPIENVLSSNLHPTSTHAPQKLPNMEGFVRKTTNSLPKLMLN